MEEEEINTDIQNIIKCGNKLWGENWEGEKAFTVMEWEDCKEAVKYKMVEDKNGASKTIMKLDLCCKNFWFNSWGETLESSSFL